MKKRNEIILLSRKFYTNGLDAFLTQYWWHKREDFLTKMRKDIKRLEFIFVLYASMFLTD